MVLRMKNFKGSWKTNIEGGIAHKGGAWTVCRFKGGAGKKEGGGAIEGRDWYPNAYYELSQNHLTHVLIQPSVIASNWCVRG